MANADVVTPDDPSQQLQAERINQNRKSRLATPEVPSGSQKERKQRRQNKAPMKVCAVCGDKAMGYNFDAVTCESCKAFFRRNALKDEDYHRCNFYNQCEINPVSRKFCQKCRLIKCFNAGMKKEWIENEEKLMQRKRKRIEKNRRISFSPDNNGHQSISRNRSLTVSISGSSDCTSDTISPTDTISGSLSDSQITPTKRRMPPLPLHPPKKVRLVEDFGKSASPNLLPRRESVIKLGPASAPSSANCEPASTSTFIWPPNDQCGTDPIRSDPFRTVTIPEAVLVNLVNTCYLCCAKAQIPMPPAVEYACALLLRQEVNPKR